ncbi:hypothetical protein Bca101_068331 [Brassica carinata]
MPVVGKEKVTWMKLTTKPLDKEENFSKVKRALCSLPQIIDQLFDEKSKETVTIKVVCCSPKEVAEKLCKKGGRAIKKIEYGIENPMAPKPKAPEKPKEGDKPKNGDKPKESDKPKNGDKPKEAGKPAPAPAASSSQTMIYNSEPGHPMYGGSYNGYNQQYGYYSVSQGAQPMYNGHPSRPIHDSYGGGDCILLALGRLFS